MNTSQMRDYLGRMGMDVPEKPNLDVLKQIQERHIYSIPVENLDIVRGNVPLSLDIDDLVRKVVEKRRGGISFELNVLLADALRELGFDVRLMSAKHPKYGNEFDHAFLMVRVPGEDGEWLVDVGYTECFRTPLLFDERFWQGDGRDEYTFVREEGAEGGDGDVWRLMRRRSGEVELVYSFHVKERAPEEYVEQCGWFCTNEQSRFTQGPFVFIERPEGRICLSMDTVTNTFTGEQIRPIVEGEEELRDVLREIFGIETDESVLEAAPDGKFGYGRVFAAIGDDALLGAVVSEAVNIGVERTAHVRFGHIVAESSRDRAEGSFPEYVQAVREQLREKVAQEIERTGKADDLIGGELVVMGSNARIGATIDTPADFAPEQLVESLVKPFNPDVVVCGESGKSRLQAFLKGSMSDYLSRKLDCEVVKVQQ